MYLQITDKKREALRSLFDQHKFGPDPGGLYSGASPEELRAEFEERINGLLTKLSNLSEAYERDQVLSYFEEMLEKFPAADTDDKDQVCTYLEAIMDILEIDGSGGLLNRWIYGFDPTDLPIGG